MATPAMAEAPRTPPVAPAARELTVVNRSRHPIYQLRISPSDADQWGDDRLGDGVIAPGGWLRVRLGRTRDCNFDVQVIYDDASREERRGLDLCRVREARFDGTAAVLPPEPFAVAHRVELENRSGRAIRQVFVSPDSADAWGDDLAPAGGIAPERMGEIQYRGGCLADLRVVFDNRAAEERRGVDICANPALVIRPGWTTDAAPPLPPPNVLAQIVAAGDEVVILNGTGGVVTELYLHPEDRAAVTAEEIDLLGNAVLPPGGRLTVRFPRGDVCRFVARIRRGGDRPEQLQSGIDLCRSPAVALEPARSG